LFAAIEGLIEGTAPRSRSCATTWKGYWRRRRLS